MTTETKEPEKTEPAVVNHTAIAERPVPAPTTAVSFGMLPRNMDEGMKLSMMLAKSTLVPKEFAGNPANIYLALQWGAELGLPPMQALQSIAVINGRPTMWGDAVLALCWASGKLETIEETIDRSDDKNPIAVCKVKRKGQAVHVTTFSWKEAGVAGLTGKPGTWQTYPLRMLQWRARGFGLRDVLPDVLRGIITAEEAQDYPGTIDAVPMAEAVDPLDLYLFDLPADEQQEFKELFAAAKQTKGQVTTLLKKYTNDPKGLKLALLKLTEKPKADETKEAKAEPKAAKADTKQPAREAVAPSVAEVFKAPVPKSFDDEVESI